MNIQHSSRSDSWMTPSWIITLVKDVLGTIDLDPASSSQANEIVGASKYFDREYDSLRDINWSKYPVSIYLNPPGGKVGNKSITGLFWNKLIEQRELDLVEHAIFMAFSAEALQHTQLSSSQPICTFPICIPKRRISFIDPEDSSKCQPSHSNVIVYVPGIVNKTSLFKEVFSRIGGLMGGI